MTKRHVFYFVLYFVFGPDASLVAGQVQANGADVTKRARAVQIPKGRIVVGGLMDIFSSIIVVVPLIVPIAKHFEVDPIHLGIIFIANSELGYLTPPVGENLFVASYRFNKPILHIARAMLPMYIILLIGVLLITYVPWLTLGILQ